MQYHRLVVEWNKVSQHLVLKNERFSLLPPNVFIGGAFPMVLNYEPRQSCFEELVSTSLQVIPILQVRPLTKETLLETRRRYLPTPQTQIHVYGACESKQIKSESFIIHQLCASPCLKRLCVIKAFGRISRNFVTFLGSRFTKLAIEPCPPSPRTIFLGLPLATKSSTILSICFPQPPEHVLEHTLLKQIDCIGTKTYQPYPKKSPQEKGTAYFIVAFFKQRKGQNKVRCPLFGPSFSIADFSCKNKVRCPLFLHLFLQRFFMKVPGGTKPAVPLSCLEKSCLFSSDISLRRPIYENDNFIRSCFENVAILGVKRRSLP